MEFESSCPSNCNRRCDHTFYNDAKEEQTKNQLPNANVQSDIIWKGTAGNPELAIALSQWYGHPRALGISIPKTLVIWASPVTLTLTLTQIAKVIREGDAHITRILGMGMPKTRGCPYHWNSATLETRRKLGRVNSRKDFWDCYWGQEQKLAKSWFAVTWQGGHVGGQYNKHFFWRIFLKMFPEERNTFVLDHQHGRCDSRKTSNSWPART